METPLAYIPIDRRHALATNTQLPLRSEGAALFADISGFTPLTEMLAYVLGPRRGAEELTRYLNLVYDALITELHRFGGSVIGFSGDAITCWFMEDDGRRATATAVAMQQAMQAFNNMKIAGDQLVSLQMKAAVSVGSVLRFVVGNPDYTLMDVMAGRTLERLAAAENQAERGEVVLTAAVAANLDELLDVEEWRVAEEDNARFAVVRGLQTAVSPAPWPPLPQDIPDQQAKAWLLPPVYERLQVSTTSFLAELRSAAALFVRFSGIDYDHDPTAPQKLDHFIQQVQAILTEFDGSLLQLTIGDKGSYLYAAFGAPIAHEDDVARAASAALAIQAIQNQFAFLNPMQMGIAYGKMRVGPYGSTLRRTYGVLGDAVNLSARLMSAAQPNQILVDEEAYQRVGTGFVWQTLPAIRVKGKSQPIALYQLMRRRQRRLDQRQSVSKPIGRDDDLRTLQTHLERARTGSGQIVRLIGQPGMGKSHLAAYFSQEAARQKILTVYGTCQSIHRGTLYHPWRQLAFALFRLDGFGEAEMIAELTRMIEREEPAWSLRLPLLGDLLDLPIPDNPTTAAMDSDTRQKALFSLLVEILQTVAQQRPLLLVLEDIHWMDEASRSLTAVIAQQAIRHAKIMLLLIQRMPELGQPHPLPTLSDLPYCTPLELNQIGTAGVADLVSQQLDGTASPLLLDVIEQMSNSNPFFITQLVETMREEEQIVRRGIVEWDVSDELLRILRQADYAQNVAGVWRLRQTVDLSAIRLGIPDSIHDLILSRLDKLPEAHKLTLKVSSVIGFYISLVLVSQAHPNQTPLQNLLVEAKFLEAEEIIEAEELARNLYAFRHHTLQEVVYETLLFTQRRALHEAIANALAQQQPDAASQIAHHAFLGEVWPLSHRFNLEAGKQAKQLHANEQSIFFFDRALSSLQEMAEEETAVSRKTIHLLLGEQYISISDFEKATYHLEQAHRLAQQQQDSEAEAQVCRWFGRSFEMRGENDRALDWLERGLTIIENKQSLEEAEICLVAGLINTRLGHYDRARALCEQSLIICQQLNDLATAARTHNLLGIVEMRGESTKAISRFEQSLAQYQQLENLYGQATSHNLLANGYFNRSEWPLADHHYRLALELFTQTGDIYNQVIVGNNTAGIARNQGFLTEALATYQKALRLLNQMGGSLFVFGVLHLNLGHTYLRLNELQQAEAELSHAESFFTKAQVKHLLPELNGVRAQLWLAREEMETAVSHAQTAITLSEEMEMPRERGQYLRVMGDIALAEQDLPKAKPYLDQSATLLSETDDVYEHAKTLLSIGRFHLLNGEREAGEAVLQQAEATFQRLGVHDKIQTIHALLQL